MPKFRKRPIVIEAEQYDGSEACAARVIERHDGHIKPGSKLGDEQRCLVIETLEGDMIVQPDDWIITGVKGERYPCKPDIFAATYEIVEG